MNQRDSDGNSALHHACKCGALDATKALIAMGANIEETTDCDCTALHVAASLANPKLCKTSSFQ